MPTVTTLNQIANDRWEKLHPSLKEIFLSTDFEKNLSDIALQYKLDIPSLKLLKSEVMFVLFLFEPVTQLQQNIENELKISSDTAASIYSEIELLIFFGMMDYLQKVSQEPDFIGIRSVVSEEDHTATTSTPKEPLELQPEGVRDAAQAPTEPTDTARPLTRDELMRALAAKRTMQGDIAATKVPEVVSPKDGPVHGYEAYRAQE